MAAAPRRRWHPPGASRPGCQRHHLIPIALLLRPQMAAMFDYLRCDEFALHRFDLNGQWLPSCESEAMRSGHALHRGPHQGYSDVVAARVEQIRARFVRKAGADPQVARRVAVRQLRLLQDMMRRALTERHGLGFWLNRRDPMRLFADRAYLDTAIDQMFAGPMIDPYGLAKTQ